MIEFDDNTCCLRINNTNLITENQYKQILSKFRYLGCINFSTTAQIREYFNKHVFLTKEQTQAVIETLNTPAINASARNDNIKTDIDAVINTFGLTDSWSKAGFILPDGRLLDLSENTDHRTNDHRIISRVIKAADPSSSLMKFMSYGIVRVIDTGIDTTQQLTDSQIKTIEHHLKYDIKHSYYLFDENNTRFYVDITDPHGYAAASFNYIINDCSVIYDIVDDINSYFKKQ